MPFLAFQMPLSNYTRKKNWPTQAEPAGKKCFHDQPEQDLLVCFCCNGNGNTYSLPATAAMKVVAAAAVSVFGFSV